jgi:glutamine synthetase
LKKQYVKSEETMLCKNNKDVMKIVRDRNVSFIQIWFTDVLGMLKSFAITPSELEGALTEGMGFDGSSIEGFARIEESDMVAKPDPTTFQFVPWRPKDRPVARMFCDILRVGLYLLCGTGVGVFLLQGRRRHSNH